jgi:hypothetical protein
VRALLMDTAALRSTLLKAPGGSDYDPIMIRTSCERLIDGMAVCGCDAPAECWESDPAESKGRSVHICKSATTDETDADDSSTAHLSRRVYWGADAGVDRAFPGLTEKTQSPFQEFTTSLWNVKKEMYLILIGNLN